MIGMLRKNQKGITLIEVVVSTAIAAALIGAFVTITFSIFRHTESSNAHMAAATNTENAAHLIIKDGQMAQTTDLIPGAAPVNTVRLSWIDPVYKEHKPYENHEIVSVNLHAIVYSLSGNNLQRSESVNGGAPAVRTVARYMTSVGFSQPADVTRLFKVSLTSSGGNPQRVSEMREYDVTLRAMA